MSCNKSKSIVLLQHLVDTLQLQFWRTSPVVHNTQGHSHPVVIWDHTIQPNNRVYITEVCFAKHTAYHGRAIFRVSWTHKSNSLNYLLLLIWLWGLRITLKPKRHETLTLAYTQCIIKISTEKHKMITVAWNCERPTEGALCTAKFADMHCLKTSSIPSTYWMWELNWKWDENDHLC